MIAHLPMITSGFKYNLTGPMTLIWTSDSDLVIVHSTSQHITTYQLDQKLDIITTPLKRKQGKKQKKIKEKKKKK